MQYNYFINDNFFNFKFSSIPAVEIREQLKQLGFRWYKPAGVWYSKTEQNALKMLEYLKLANIEGTTTAEGTANTTEQATTPLFTRLQQFSYDDMPAFCLDTNGQPTTHIHSNTTAFLKAAKKHLIEYFDNEKLNLSMTQGRGGYTTSLHCDIMGSIFPKDSQILKDIQNYCKRWLKAFNYNNSDPYTDYYDVNFYGGYFEIDYHYIQIGTTADLQAIENQYNSMKQADEQAKAEQRKKEYEEQQKAEAIRRAEAEKIEAENQIKLKKIIADAIIKDYDEANSYVLTNCNTNGGKETLTESLEYIKKYNNENKKADFQIIRDITLADDAALDLVFNYYCCADIMEFYTKNYDGENYNHLGGYNTFDTRANNSCGLTAEQRETIKYYYTNCIAVYVKNDLKLIVDTEGYAYARYLAFATESSQKLSYKDYAEQETKAAEQKPAFYIPEALDKQLDNALEAGTLKQNQIITVISEDNWMGMAHAKVWKYNRYEKTKYAQYDDAIAFYGTPKAKQKFKSGTYYTYFYHSPKVVILDGAHIIPDKVKYESVKEENGFIIKSHIMGPDADYWKRLKAWLKEENITAIVDTVAA